MSLAGTEQVNIGSTATVDKFLIHIISSVSHRKPSQPNWTPTDNLFLTIVGEGPNFRHIIPGHFFLLHPINFKAGYFLGNCRLC